MLSKSKCTAPRSDAFAFSSLQRLSAKRERDLSSNARLGGADDTASRGGGARGGGLLR